MTPLHSLITALVRLLGLYFCVTALENAAAPLFSMLQHGAMTEVAATPFPNPWVIFLPMAAFYLVLAGAIFLCAPPLSRWMIGSEKNQDADVPWHETLLFCTGILILSWAFVRLTEVLYRFLVARSHRADQDLLDPATMLTLFLTAILLGSGVLLVMKFHRLSAWMARRRETALNSSPSGRK